MMWTSEGSSSGCRVYVSVRVQMQVVDCYEVDLSQVLFDTICIAITTGLLAHVHACRIDQYRRSLVALRCSGTSSTLHASRGDTLCESIKALNA